MNYRSREQIGFMNDHQERYHKHNGYDRRRGRSIGSRSRK